MNSATATKAMAKGSTMLLFDAARTIWAMGQRHGENSGLSGTGFNCHDEYVVTVGLLRRGALERGFDNCPQSRRL